VTRTGVGELRNSLNDPLSDTFFGCCILNLSEFFLPASTVAWPPIGTDIIMAQWTPQSKIIIETYNPDWVTEFNTIKTSVEAALKGTAYTSIEHVGSTSVPGLAAKPVIDIDIIVAHRSDVDPVINAITSNLGYEYIGEMGIIDRHAFRLRGAVPPRNLYACVDGSVSLRNHLGVRDLLRENEALKEEYGNVKKDLAGRVKDIDEYIEGKSEILQKILKQAGVLSKEELDAIEKANLGDVMRVERRKVNPSGSAVGVGEVGEPAG
jgi:GrpB-like predicted nucleotidyltransferase (UPF0157 family)